MIDKDGVFIADYPTIITHVDGCKLDKPIELRTGERFQLLARPISQEPRTIDVTWEEFSE